MERDAESSCCVVNLKTLPADEMFALLTSAREFRSLATSSHTRVSGGW